jgi:putative sigma-54 modulation protein
MPIEITGRHIEVPEREKERVRERVTRLERHAGSIDDARIIVTGEKHRVTVEAIVSSRRQTWKAKEETADIPTALTAALDKIETQAKRDRARRKDKKHGPSLRDAVKEWEVKVLSPESLRSAGSEKRIVMKTSKIPIKPMSAEEAALELEDSRSEFIVYRDSGSERVSVLYKRRDGNFGLIAPEW